MCKKTNIIELILIFIISFIFSMIFLTLDYDDIWNFGFAYNVSTGLIPYRDFNMVTTPLYPLVDSIFLTIFGRNIYVHYAVNAIILTIIYAFMKKNYPKAYYIPFAILLLLSRPNYNLICLLFLYIILLLEEKNKNDYLIGIILGLTFLTKQSIGIYLCLPSLFTKDIKKIVKRIVGFIIPIIPTMLYLTINKALYAFIDYCFLGIGEFSDKNFCIISPMLILLFAGIAYCIINYLKTKDYKNIYHLCFLGMAYPLIDYYHVLLAIIPILGYFLNNMPLNKKIIGYSFVTFLFTVSFINLCIERDKYSFPNSTNKFKYCKLENNVVDQINKLTAYVSKSDDNTYIIEGSGYLVKLELNKPIGKYDFFLNGNVGKNGSSKIIKTFDEKCRIEKCTFIVNKYAYATKDYSQQYNKELHRYVVNNYQEVDEIIGLTVYNNH